ncbi:MAG: hypothetical protein JNK81_13195 [Anaerolineales bacterium]|nr:hypothetical protein [Anaerolineales bacterium]
MKQNYFSKTFYIFCLFVLVACQAQTTPTEAIPTTIPTIIPTSTAIVYQATAPDATKNIGEIVATIPLKSENISFVYGFGSIWAAQPRDGVVVRIDLATNTVVAEIKVGMPTGNDYYPTPGGITVTSERVWTSVTNAISNDKNGQSKLVGIDPTTNEIVEEIPLGNVKYPQITLPFKTAWAITNDNNTLWVGDFYQGVVLPVDIQSKQVIATIMQVDHVTELVPFDNSIWAILHRKDGIARIDPSTNTIIATIPLPLEEHGPSDICSWCVNGMAVGDGNVWVSLGLAKAIAKIDPETNQAVTRKNFEG